MGSQTGTYIPFSVGVPGILKLLGLSVASAAVVFSREGDITLVECFWTSYHEVEFGRENIGQHVEGFATGHTRGRRARKWHEDTSSHAKTASNGLRTVWTHALITCSETWPESSKTSRRKQCRQKPP